CSSDLQLESTKQDNQLCSKQLSNLVKLEDFGYDCDVKPGKGVNESIEIEENVKSSSIEVSSNCKEKSDSARVKQNLSPMQNLDVQNTN
ncbi:unnamed protein product, partial [Leptidea sinapis]